MALFVSLTLTTKPISSLCYLASLLVLSQTSNCLPISYLIVRLPLYFKVIIITTARNTKKQIMERGKIMRFLVFVPISTSTKLLSAFYIGKRHLIMINLKVLFSLQYGK